MGTSLWRFFIRRTQRTASKDEATVNRLNKPEQNKTTGLNGHSHGTKGPEKLTNTSPRPKRAEKKRRCVDASKIRAKRRVAKDLSMERELSLKIKTGDCEALWSRTDAGMQQRSKDFADSTASFRLRCEEHATTLPEINLDLSDEELNELAPRVRESWLRLQAILES